MSKRRIIILLAMAMIAAGTTLTGCSGSGTTASAPAAAAKTADVRISAAFPVTATTSAVKSLLPADTQAIYVYVSDKPIYDYYQMAQLSYKLKLTPSQASGNIKLVPGNYWFYAAAFDTVTEIEGKPSGTMLAGTASGGVVNAGSNRVVLSFLNGQWTVVDTNNNPSHIELSDNTTRLYDIILGGEQYPQQGYASKTALDFSKPYGIGWGPMRYRFNNNDTADTSGTMFSQFIGDTNTLVLDGGMYNLTQKCSNSGEGHYMVSCEEKAGDRMVMIPGIQDYESSSGSSSESELLLGSAYALLPNGGRTTFTQNGQPFDLFSRFTAATLTDGATMTGNLVEIAVTTYTKTLNTTPSPAAAKVAVLPKKSISPNTLYSGVTATHTEMYVCATKEIPNTGTWQFNGDPIKFGTATCYEGGSIRNFDLQTSQLITPNPGDFSYGLAPTDPNNLGDYCHEWDSSLNTCKIKAPPTGDVYYPYNFIAKKSDTKTAIDYGSFKVNFHVQSATTGNIYVYPFRAKGSTTVTAARK